MAEGYQSMKTPGAEPQNDGATDWASIPLEAALERLRATREGLTMAEAEKRLVEFGPNKLPEEKVNPFMVFLSFM